MEYNGDRPAGDVPTWMNDKHSVWYRDPAQVVANMLANPDFDGEMDYAPLQEVDTNGELRYKNLMSGSWAWEQAVSSLLYLSVFCVELTGALHKG